MTNPQAISVSSGLDVAPKRIETEHENEQALAAVETLLVKGEDNLTPEEFALLDLLGTLIEHFERSFYNLPKGDPVGVLQVLMDGQGLKPTDLAQIVGSRARVSEILSRKRSISKDQAKALGTFFNVSPAAFI